MDLALNNLQRLICHKTNQPTNQPTFIYRQLNGPKFCYVTQTFEFNIQHLFSRS